jgi:transcriptional regulator with PAS, ATPase and Fis domain
MAMYWDKIKEELKDAYLSNPYTEDVLLKKRHINHQLSNYEIDLIKLTDKRGFLSIGHKEACEKSDPNDVLNVKYLSAEQKLWREKYIRWILAAGRAFRSLEKIKSTSPWMKKLKEKTWAACFGKRLSDAMGLENVIRDLNVLICGETGTGKELIANVIAQAFPGVGDKSAPNKAINAAALVEGLVESELFGHTKGAFTGAKDSKIGQITVANGGTFFIDEIGDLPLTTQAKLLRVIETGIVVPVGSTKENDEKKVTVRYIAATHKNLHEMVEKQEFRQDLYERLSGIVITIPPLRDRREDISGITDACIAEYIGDNPLLGPIQAEIKSKLDAFNDHEWKGNVRELKNYIRNWLLDLEPRTEIPGGHSQDLSVNSIPEAILTGKATLEDLKKWYITKVLESNKENYTKTAGTLGINRTTVKAFQKRTGKGDRSLS